MKYFTSDEHYWHNNVIKYCSRPYTSVDEMNEDLVAKHNSIVKPEDEVYRLGDFSLAFRPVEIYPYRLHGTKYLVPGNHDFCHSYHKKSRSTENREKWLQKYRDHGFIILPEQTTLELEGIGIVNLCHHPYADPTTKEDEGGYEDKYARWRPVDDGKVLLCGHIHEKWKTKKSSKGTLMINVGVDAHNGYPISVEQIKQIIEENKDK